jgi:hypothetical protein
VPSSSSPLVELLADVQQAFGALGLRWYLFGAQAAILHGAARLTADVDVTVDPGSRSSTELVGALTAAGFELRAPSVEGFVESTRVLPLVHRRSRIPVDVVLAGPGLEELFFARAEERAIGSIRVPVVSAEDLVTMKVLAGRVKDLDDVAAIVRAHGDAVDVERIRATLRLLETALDRSDLVSALEGVLATARRGARGGRQEGTP